MKCLLRPLPLLAPSLLAPSLLALPLLAAGCSKQDEKARTPGQAEGEILPGSASDAMIPLDSLRSQPPLAPQAEEGSAPEDARSGKGKSPASDAKPAAAKPSAAADSGTQTPAAVKED